MKLISLQVWNYRSINDSGPIDASRITALLGRNESGKTNVLLALKSLNPVGGMESLNKIKDFPRHRRLEECTDQTKVLSTKWELTDSERGKLTEILPQAKAVTHINVGRNYGDVRWVSFDDIAPIAFDRKAIKTKTRKIVAAVSAKADRLEDDTAKNQLSKAADSFGTEIQPLGLKTAWAEKAQPALLELRKALATADVDLTEKQDANIVELEDLAEEITGYEGAHAKARSWVVEKLPIFIYLDEYPELQGHQNIAQYLQRKSSKPDQLTEAEKNFEKLCKVAGLRPQELQSLLNANKPEERNQLANRASAVVTKEIRRLWKDRTLKIRFNPDAEYMDTFVSDPNATYDVEVNLDERSRGFKWFFSFYITFAADTQGGEAENAVLLLDEPGLFLHAKSQADLLMHFEEDFENQILYTTHSPFMVPVHNLDSIRTVNIEETSGTTVTNDPTGDSRTLFPLQAALGYDLSQSMFLGANNLVVEGVTDYWVLSSVSEYLSENGRISLSTALTITPAGGAQKISYMVALLTSEKLNVLVLFDKEKDAETTKDELVKSKLIRDNNVVFVTEAFASSTPKEADIEDLLDPDVYIDLIKESYSKELKGKKLNLNDKIPRIAKRVEAAFKDLGVTLHKSRPTRLLLNKMAKSPEDIVTPDAKERFESLFEVINERFEKHIARQQEPFE